MGNCQVCTAKTQTFLCRNHADELADMLDGLVHGVEHPNGSRSPGWLELLADATTGRTRMGSGRSNPPSALHGDDEVLPPCGTCSHSEHERSESCGVVIPAVTTTIALAGSDEAAEIIISPERPCDCGEYIPALTQTQIRNRFLAAGRVNARAARVADSVNTKLIALVRHLEETHKVRFVPLQTVGRRFIGPLLPGWRRLPKGYVATGADMAGWLHAHVSALALDEAAKEHYFDIKGIVDDIERVINRPVPWRWCGPCPTWDEKTNTYCGHELNCRDDAREVYCRHCHRTHNPDRLQLAMVKELLAQQLTIADILKANRMLPEDFRVSERTLRHWRQHNLLLPCNWRDDEPLYLWADIERLKAKKHDDSACRMTTV